MKIRELLSEISPHNFDSDVDYHNAVAANRNKHEPDQDDVDNYPAHPGFPKKSQDPWNRVKTKDIDREGVAPNGKKYNMLHVINGDERDAKWAEHQFHKHEWGAKTVVDTEVKRDDVKGNMLTIVLFVVDNHKHGHWKPWSMTETATAGATSAANIGTVDAPQLSPGKARGKKSYTGSPGKSGTKAPPQPKVVQPKTSAGTAVNALDMKGKNIFGQAAESVVIKRR